jgi:dienelactone hydrolase
MFCNTLLFRLPGLPPRRPRIGRRVDDLLHLGFESADVKAQSQTESIREKIAMAWRRLGAVLSALCLLSTMAAAQEVVHFPSLDAGVTMLDGYLYRPPGGGPHPAIVGLHGCSGMFVRASGQMTGLYRAWGAELASHGYVVLLVDSFGPRHHGEMCSIAGFDLWLYRDRPKDAYGALTYLQAQDFVRADRVGVIGWSQGGGVTLLSIGEPSVGRPRDLTRPDFRAAVAFYPGSCRTERLPAGWTTAIPLLVLIGEADVWTPAAPCQEAMGAVAARGAPITMQTYPGAYHGFDAPNVTQRELPDYRTRAGVVPIVGTDPAARADALRRVPEFFARYLGG